VNGGVVIYGDLTKLNIIEAMQKIRMNFDFFSSNARSRTKDKYSIGSWGLSFERLLTKTIEPGSI
jgi:hypothetical protein